MRKLKQIPGILYQKIVQSLRYNDDINYDMNHTSLDDIINLHLKKFTDNVKENPYNGLKICFYECTS